MLLGSYRAGDANDPETYVRAVTAVLSMYPVDVIRKVADPAKGLPSRLQYLPRIAEVKSACEEEMQPIYRQRERERIDAERKARRLALAAPDAPKPTREELVAKHGPNYGLTPSPKEEELAARQLKAIGSANEVMLGRLVEKLGTPGDGIASPALAGLLRRQGRVGSA